MPETISSTDDKRTINNVMRHEYKVLSDSEKCNMKAIKDQGLGFVEMLEQMHNVPSGGKMPSRELALAVTKIEEAVMWAIKDLTK
jgi:predicted DNA-binding ArsR family transcriptional regulator